jgi:hypothetical protein
MVPTSFQKCESKPALICYACLPANRFIVSLRLYSYINREAARLVRSFQRGTLGLSELAQLQKGPPGHSTGCPCDLWHFQPLCHF